MRRRRKGRGRAAAAEPSFGMTPMLNIIMLLIPFLIMSAGYIKYGVLDVTAPRIDPDGKKRDRRDGKKARPRLDLTVSITRRGFTLLTRKGRVSPGCRLEGGVARGGLLRPTIPGFRRGYDFGGLTRCLVRLKKLHPQVRRIYIAAEPQIRLDTVVAVMDASRKTRKGRALFDRVSVSVGVM